jgi:hypothetical protein
MPRNVRPSASASHEHKARQREMVGSMLGTHARQKNFCIACHLPAGRRSDRLDQLQ